MKKALICGISGQDGAYLAKLLLSQGYEVYGGSRDAQMASLRNLHRLGIQEKVKVISISINDFRSVLQTLLKVKPDEVYNLAGQSSVGLSFEQPVETLESISVGTLNLLEAIRFSDLPIKFYNAGSSECFGDTGTIAADELTPFRPRSPYGVAKAAAFWQVANYREAYQLHACTGILFNHESPLRPERFVTQKIVAAACRIANGSNEALTLGNIDIARDWGWAPDYVEAMWLMLQHEKADDYVIATGQTNKLSKFIEVVFASVGLDWQDHVRTDESFYRPTDIAEGHANASKALDKLGWQAKHKMAEVAELMVREQIGMLDKEYHRSTAL
jgi:GDPmannose 4,6-dehydratase